MTPKPPSYVQIHFLSLIPHPSSLIPHPSSLIPARSSLFPLPFARPGGMRGAIKSAAPKRRPGLDRRTPLRSPGRFTSPPLRRPRAFRRADRRTTVGLPSDYRRTTVGHRPTDPFGTLGRSLAALGALLWRSWAISAARTSIFDRLSQPKSREECSEERF